MNKAVNSITFLLISINVFAAVDCTPAVQQSTPPRLVNGEWVKTASPSQAEIISNDFDKLKQKQYTFVFSGIYSREASFAGKSLSFIKTQKVWQGKVPKTIDLSVDDLPTDSQCNKMTYDKEYIFFAKLGPRKKPISVKEFRQPTPKLKTLLGQPQKRWLRGRLINTPSNK